MTTERPKRILHVVGGMNRGGAEAMIMNAFRHIDRERFVFDFAVSTDQPCAFDDEIRDMGGRIFAHPNTTEVGIRGWERAFGETITREGPFAAVHSHVFGFSGFALRAATKLRVPIRIAHSHNTQDGKRTSIGRRAYRWWTRRLTLANATHLLACSEAAGEVLFGPECTSPHRFQVIANAIDLTSFGRCSDDSQQRIQLREQLGIPSGCLLIGHVGRFNEQKNHAFLIEIIAALRELNGDVHAVLAGDGPLRTEITARVKSLGLSKNIHFLGVRSDVPVLMRMFDVFLLPSLHEGLPVVLVEAQAAGVPAVISDSITREADLGLGLVKYMNLQTASSEWANSVMESATTARLDFNTRADALRVSGYDMAVNVSRLESIYAGAASTRGL